MNNPLLLTSLALLAGVAARPINPEQRGDDLAEIGRSPAHNDDSQAFLGRMPSQGSFNSLQLHDIHDTTALQSADETLAGSASPRIGTIPDPGLSSPYIAAQRFLSSFGDKELGSPALSPTSLDPSSPSPFKPSSESEPNETTFRPAEVPEYSPAVVALVISSVASLVLLGLTVAVIYVTQFVRRTLLGQNVWSAVSRGGKKNGPGLGPSEKEKLGGMEEKMIEGDSFKGDDEKALIAAREVPAEFRSSHPFMEEKGSDEHFEDAIDDPDEMPLPKVSVPAMREKANDGRLVASFVAWTYDNWATHFMIALFGWIGAFFGGRQ